MAFQPWCDTWDVTDRAATRAWLMRSHSCYWQDVGRDHNYAVCFLSGMRRACQHSLCKAVGMSPCFASWNDVLPDGTGGVEIDCGTVCWSMVVMQPCRAGMHVAATARRIPVTSERPAPEGMPALPVHDGDRVRPLTMTGFCHRNHRLGASGFGAAL
jgi:hypothetical protein